MKCWNCLEGLSPEDKTCPGCGEPSQPNKGQILVIQKKLAYLKSEIRHWNFLEEEERQRLVAVYEARGSRLDEVIGKAIKSSWPASDWDPPVNILDGTQPKSPQELTKSEDHAKLAAVEHQAAPSASLNTEDIRSVQELTTTSPPIASPPAKPIAPISIPKETLSSKVLAEADIRWFHSLGALLVVVAVIGWLRATWDDYGRNLACIMFLTSPVALQALASRLKASLPLSARLLSILSGLLVAPALLSVEVFNFLPPEVSAKAYWTLALMVSSSILGWQAQLIKERVPLFMAALCAVMAGWSQGALATAVLCLTVSYIYFPQAEPEDALSSAQAWAADRQRISIMTAIFGCFSALFLFRPEQNLWMPMIVFTAALVYLHLPTLTNTPLRLGSNLILGQAAFSVLGLILMHTQLGIPLSAVGLYALLASGLFLAARPDDKLGLLPLRIGTALGILGIVTGLFFQDTQAVASNSTGKLDGFMRFTISIVGAGLFAGMSRLPHLESQRKGLGFAAMLATLGGTYRLSSALSQDNSLAIVLAALGLWVVLWMIATRWLESEEQPLVWAVALAVFTPTIGIALIELWVQSKATQDWALLVIWLGAIALAWHQNALGPALDANNQSNKLISQIASLILARAIIWSIANGLIFLGTNNTELITATLMLVGFTLLLLGPKSFTQPGFEMLWLVEPSALVVWWDSSLTGGRYFPVVIAIAAGWAASGRLRPLSLSMASALSSIFVLASPSDTSHLALLSLPLLFSLALVSPVPGRTFTSAAWGRIGFDILLCCSIYVPLKAAKQSSESLAVAVLTIIACLAIKRTFKYPLAQRVVALSTCYCLMFAGFIWASVQGLPEAGIFLIAFSAMVFVIDEEKITLETRHNLSGGLAIVGVSWLATIIPGIKVFDSLIFCLLASEVISLAIKKWQPSHANALLLCYATLDTNFSASEQQVQLVILLGYLALLRGILHSRKTLAAAGVFAALSNLDISLVGLGAGIKIRLIAMGLILVGAGLLQALRLNSSHCQDLIQKANTHLRAGIALIALPSMLNLLVSPEWSDFILILVTAGSCLGLSSALAKPVEVSQTFRQLGGWVLTGWAAISLARVTLILPWQLATSIVGIILIAIGIIRERKRK